MFGVYRLQNQILEYAWGSRTAIAELLGRPSPSPSPEAELWMGAHPLAPSTVVHEGERLPLGQLIAASPETVLGTRVAARFGGQLPFLLKILAAEEPLSVQVHPRREQAREGFARESSERIPLDDERRTYRDPNPKPELLCALTDFAALCGFRPPAEIGRLLLETAPGTLATEIDRLQKRPDPEGVRQLVSALVAVADERRRPLLGETLRRAEPRRREPAFDCVCRLHEHYPDDVWILAPLLLNLVELRPGQALYTESGILHSYLGGTGVELMGSSDNVVRAGLTRKRVDREELERLTCFDPSPVRILEPATVAPAEVAFETAASEFRLSVLEVGSDEPYVNGQSRQAGSPGPSVEILICVDGEAVLATERGGRESCRQGDSFLVAAAALPYRIEGRARIFKAQVPP